MTNIEKIISRILDEANSEAASISENAQKEIIRLEFENEDKIKADVTNILAGSRKTAADILERGKSAAEMEARKYTLGVKQQIISEVFDLAAKKLASLPKEEYVKTISRIAASASETGEEELIFSDRDDETVGAEITAAANAILASEGKKAELTLSKETRPMMGGVILKNGKVEINCDVKVLVNAKKEQLTSEVVSILFADAND